MVVAQCCTVSERLVQITQQSMGMGAKERAEDIGPILRGYFSRSAEFLYRLLMSVQLSQYDTPRIMQKRVRFAERDGFLDVRQGKIVSAERRMRLMPAEIGVAVLGILPDNLMGKLQIPLRIGAQKIEG